MNKEMQDWLKRQGMSSIEEAQGKHLPDAVIFEPGSEADEIFQVETHGDKVRVYDGYGFNAWYTIDRIRKHVAEYGQIKTIDGLPACQCKPPEGYEE